MRLWSPKARRVKVSRTARLLVRTISADRSRITRIGLALAGSVLLHSRLLSLTIPAIPAAKVRRGSNSSWTIRELSETSFGSSSGCSGQTQIRMQSSLSHSLFLTAIPLLRRKPQIRMVTSPILPGMKQERQSKH